MRVLIFDGAPGCFERVKWLAEELPNWHIRHHALQDLAIDQLTNGSTWDLVILGSHSQEVLRELESDQLVLAWTSESKKNFLGGFRKVFEPTVGYAKFLLSIEEEAITRAQYPEFSETSSPETSSRGPLQEITDRIHDLLPDPSSEEGSKALGEWTNIKSRIYSIVTHYAGEPTIPSLEQIDEFMRGYIRDLANNLPDGKNNDLTLKLHLATGILHIVHRML